MTGIPDAISLYIHIPFCAKKCRYCDFYSIPYDTDGAGRFITALAAEWELVKQEFKLDNTRIRTVFFGGGTPSMLSLSQWETVGRLLMKKLSLSPGCEWTVECNPDSFTEDKAGLWLSLGVTRLTFGIQSLDDRELGFLGRRHVSAQALAALDSPILTNFKSIGADLMYGLPGQTVLTFENTVAAILSHPVVSHLSAYELTINPATPFGRHCAKIPFPEEDEVLDMAKMLYGQCRTQGFDRYEISNFAKPGHRCRHNEAYWDHSPYIGLGPAAHSYIAPHRFANTRDVSRYISDIGSGKKPLEFTETIDMDNLIPEMIFLRLRTSDGLDENEFSSKTGYGFYSGARAAALDELARDNFISYEKPRWSLTEQGMFMADAIAKKLV
jgi:oxygen-independent coproporphyrinogen-3 oxidase